MQTNRYSSREFKIEIDEEKIQTTALDRQQQQIKTDSSKFRQTAAYSDRQQQIQTDNSRFRQQIQTDNGRFRQKIKAERSKQRTNEISNDPSVQYAQLSTLGTLDESPRKQFLTTE
ncbi:hypothetical protein Tco_1098206 [Tanacetum coccineum]